MRSIIKRNRYMIITIVITAVITYFCISATNGYFNLVSLLWSDKYGASISSPNNHDIIINVYKSKAWWTVRIPCYSEKIKSDDSIKKNLSKWYIYKVTETNVKLQAVDGIMVIQHNCT